MISHQYKCIFIHQRKAGGYSIISDFGFQIREVEWHLYNDGTLSEEWKFRKTIAKGYIVFTVVRNPWDRFISGWKYLNNYRDKTLAEVLQEASNIKGPRDYKHLVRPQLDILMNEKGIFVPDYVLRFENLQEDYNKLSHIIGKKESTLPRLNETSHEHYTAYFDSKTKKTFEALFKKDIDFFGYKFGKDCSNVKFSSKDL